MAIREFVGVYEADGGLRGDAAYVWGKLRGTTHCALVTVLSVHLEASAGGGA